MPIYEYVCRDCREELELLVRGSETPTCTQCGGNQLEKLLSVPAAHSASSSRSLPVCDGPAPRGQCGMGGCGLPECE